MTTPTSKIRIPERLYFRIGDVAELLDVKPHVLRYWESEFPSLAPRKSGSGQRVYCRSDVETLLLIKGLLHEERYSIEGARRRIRELKTGCAGKAMSPESRRALLEEIRELARTPLSRIFQYSAHD